MGHHGDDRCVHATVAPAGGEFESESHPDDAVACTQIAALSNRRGKTKYTRPDSLAKCPSGLAFRVKMSQNTRRPVGNDRQARESLLKRG
jgi:hypothetical protein